MKTMLFALIALVSGLGVGLANSWREFSTDESYGFAKPSASGMVQSSSLSRQTGRRPRLELVDDATFDFGVMAKEELRSNVFRVLNGGEEQLELRFESMTCQCTNIVLDGRTMPRDERWATTVAPNQTLEITLTWQPTKYDLDFQQSATFLTNDPTRPELQLIIKGRVQQITRYDPLAVDFGSIARDKPQRQSVDVISYRDQDFAVKKVEFLGLDHREFFDVEISPMPDEKIKADVGSLSGSVVTVTLKSGLPVGKTLQQIRIHTNKPDVQPIDMRVEADVVSDIQVFFPGKYRPEDGLVVLGTLPGDKPTEFVFWFLIKGEYAATVEMTPVVTEPADVISVSLDQPQRIGPTSKIQAKLTVTPTGKFVNRTGSNQGEFGKLVFKTNHPDVEEMVVPVSFRVEARK